MSKAMTIELDYDIGDEVWVAGRNHEPERAIVADIEVVVKVLPKGRKGRPCATYIQSWGVGTTKEQIEELIQGSAL